MSRELKEQLLEACRGYVKARLDRIEKAIKDLEDALKLETKCSMGDKYETGRAMLHLEFEKLSGQHTEFLKLRQTLNMIEPSFQSDSIRFGSLVRTTKVNYFVAIPAGELVVGQEKFYAIGTNAPIARALIGKKAGEDVTFNTQVLHIEQVI